MPDQASGDSSSKQRTNGDSNLQKFGSLDQHSALDDASGGGGAGSSPSTISINDAVRPLVKQFVRMTNSTLASFEMATNETSTMFVSRLKPLMIQGGYIATRALSAYEQRGQYGAPIVAGSAILFGGLVAVRTGKFPGALAAGMAGTAAYGNIYGFQDF